MRGGKGRRDFRLLFAAYSASVFGDQLTLVALPLATFAETGSAVAVGVVASAEAITAVAFGLVAGALGDRLPRRRVLVLTDLGRTAILVALVVALLLPGSALAALFVAAIGLGLLGVLHDAAESAVVPLVVAPADLVAANGRLHASQAASTGVGPAVAGALASAGGPALAFAADAATFLTSGVALGRIRSLDEEPAAADDDVVTAVRTTIRADVVEGLRALLADRFTVELTAVVAASNVVAVAVEAQFIPYAKEVLGIGALGVGAYFALGGISAVLTALLAGRSEASRGDLVLAGLAVFAAGVLVAGLIPSFLTVALAYVAAGAGSSLVVTHSVSFVHRRFPVRLQGRVRMARRVAVFVLVPVALVGGGFVSAHAGPEVLFVAAGAFGLAVAAWGAAAGLGAVRQA